MWRFVEETLKFHPRIIRFTKAGELGPNKLCIFFVRGYLEGPKYGPLTYAIGTQVTVHRSFPAIWRETIHRQKNFPPPKTQPFN